MLLGEGVQVDDGRLEVHARDVRAWIVVQSPAVDELGGTQPESERELMGFARLERDRPDQAATEAAIDQPLAIRVLSESGDREDQVAAVDIGGMARGLAAAPGPLPPITQPGGAKRQR